MADLFVALGSELERLSPPDPSSEPDWAAALKRGRDGRRGSRRYLLVALVVAVAATVPAIAFSSGVRSLLGFSGPSPVFAQSKVLVSAPVGNGFFAHMVTAPSTSGGWCQFTVLDHSPAMTKPPTWRSFGGGGCSMHGGGALARTTAAQPLSVEFGIARRLKGESLEKWVPPVVSGAVDPSLHAARVAVVWKGGANALVLRGTHFIGGSAALYLPPFREFPFVVTVYDRSGRVVAHKKLDSPSLLLLSHGWKEYARLYHAWEKKHRP